MRDRWGPVEQVKWIVLLPVGAAVALVAAYQAWSLALGWRTSCVRRGTWYWRVWWFYGYRGPYQIDWWMKARARGETE